MNSMKLFFTVQMRRIHWWLPMTRTTLRGKIEGQSLVLDYLDISQAEIVDCEILYGGGACSLVNSKISGCRFSFFGSAANSLLFLQLTSGAADGSGRPMIENTFPEAFKDSAA